MESLLLALPLAIPAQQTLRFLSRPKKVVPLPLVRRNRSPRLECFATRPSKPGRTILVEWKNDKLVTITSKRPVCVTFNTRNFCPDDTSPQHGDHSGSLCCDANTVPPLSPTTDLTKVSYNVVTTYRPGAWQQALQPDAGITHLYPNLVHDIIHGSPIGNPPLDPILFTFITCSNLP